MVKNINRIRKAAIVIFCVSVLAVAGIVLVESKGPEISKWFSNLSTQPEDDFSRSDVAPPSVTPTISPSLRSLPSAEPTPAPSESPVRRSFPNSFGPVGDYFRLKMLWTEGYVWQENTREMSYCAECVSCGKDLTFTAEGAEVCTPSKCASGNQLWIVSCNDDNGRRGDVFEAIPVQESVGFSLLSIAGSDLCLERRHKRYIVVQICNPRISQQRFSNPSKTEAFQLTPFYTMRDEEPYCVTQHHEPKGMELIGFIQCEVAHRWDTGYWQTYPVK